MMARAAEDYLTAWHGRHANATHVFAGMRDDAGCTSYERLTALVAPDHVVLDIACGAGELLALVPDTALRFGVDICEPELALAAARLPSVGFVRARAQSLPFADRSMDAVVCHMALMLMDDPDAVLEECRRVLRPGGVFGAIANRPTEPDAVAKLVLGALRDALRCGDASRRPPPLGDPRTHDAAALTRLLGSYFTNVTAEIFTVSQPVARADLWSFMVRSIYGLDAIADEEGTRILASLTLPDPVCWTVPMVQVQGRATV